MIWLLSEGYTPFLFLSTKFHSIPDEIKGWCIHRPKTSAPPKTGRGTYGPQRIQVELRANGIVLGRDHIARLRREMGLQCVCKRPRYFITASRSVFRRLNMNLVDFPAVA
ncbi:HTH-like domain-containing protein [Alkalispirochaeta americana]|uniref:HTH-like domain-containing protein n=1 Tax=Alkalispirochaeta americana TaxID=159291 RepID=A0A1N6XYR5_9SPIO|nr:HTH-like domain-containing protein [Alkalispirochaeta americana]